MLEHLTRPDCILICRVHQLLDTVTLLIIKMVSILYVGDEINIFIVFLQVFCDHQPDISYTIIQQRMYGNVNFNRNYNDYQIGFGSLSQGDFWIGLLTMHHLTSQGMIVGMLRLRGRDHKGLFTLARNCQRNV